MLKAMTPLSQRVRQLDNLIGGTLQLPTLQRQLRQLKQRSVVDSMSDRLGKLGSDPTQAVLTSRSPTRPAARDLSLRNDGNAAVGSGGDLVLQSHSCCATVMCCSHCVDGDPNLAQAWGR